jgi:hypothetical protein
LACEVSTLPSSRQRSTPPPKQLAWGVLVVSSYVPCATCLTQALAGQVLLTHYGYSTVVRVGVTKVDGKGTFQAHAWLESNGTVVIGESEVAIIPLTKGG